ncbi:N-terminal ig-like domain of cellulase [Catalinimonas alkaloidigena]|uniref:N-terminal ig-like domain of cellulase n=1 Tax=Catalinimonas alkaloidigena TaxID=1075417 RepID=A0A1G9M343_9BACT|nr:glycoside hydrolase family 9 protein [Catalinimonas alkaloidigena]SDL68371.1 N-terminal ig-like domain of cellulase [Catalinimonas alkaloidigena]
MTRSAFLLSTFFWLAGMLGLSAQTPATSPDTTLRLNAQEYLEMPGLNVMLAHDFYPEGHQGGVGIIQNGLRVATNGDLRLEPTPGQWQPVPKVGERQVDPATQEISVRMAYPDPEKDRKGFNPVIYPDLQFSYVLKVRPEGKAFRISVDLDEPLPEAWVGKVGFNFELFPGILFGKAYYMDGQAGIFHPQANGPGYLDENGDYQLVPMAVGKQLVVAPEAERQTMVIENLQRDSLQLIDGRARHTNGWFVVRSLVPRGATKNAIEWRITPHALPGWQHDPVVQVSQVGYHPKQQKIAVIETDPHDTRTPPAILWRVSETGGREKVLETRPHDWGNFLRYHYYQLDFTSVEQPGLYQVEYGDYRTEPFQIKEDIYQREVWQPTLEYFLPVQMCHMRVNDRYRVWHDFCHLDDARMAPTDTNHFDGYLQGPSTLTSYQGGDPVPGLNRGGWHDAGDFDLRVESQAKTVQGLALAYEAFDVAYDNTTIDQQTRVVEIHQPDGKPDILQQIEHGVLTIAGGYRSLGRLYRGIICPSLRQYVLLGDAAAMTDNTVFQPDPTLTAVPPIGQPGSPDDRWVFTEENPGRELSVAAGLAAAARALKDYNPTMAQECLTIAQALWDRTQEKNPLQRVDAAVELLLTTREKKYADFLVSQTEAIRQNIARTGWIVGRSLPLVNQKKYTRTIRDAVKQYRAQIDAQGQKTPYGVPYEPNIWGAGWGIQHFGVEQYFLHTAFPDLFPADYMLHAMNFVLGCHPGTNTASFASGVGARSLLTAYGLNRADWSYIPGGIGSGTALIRPDFPELLTWPFLWQQTEYVLGGGTTDYLFLILAADHLMNP